MSAHDTARSIHAQATTMQRTWGEKQARFWIVAAHGGLVRIKLRPGQTVSHYFCQETDEGYTSEATVYAFDGRTVTAQDFIDGRDCDGRLSDTFESTCDYSELRAGNVVDGERFPLWQQAHTGRRDYAPPRRWAIEMVARILFGSAVMRVAAELVALHFLPNLAGF